MPKESKLNTGQAEENDVKPQGQGAREYVCPCGLRYKSYPAVYTHIKTKHKNEEVAMRAKIVKPQDDNPGVGRPKKTRNLHSAKEEAEIMTLSDNFVIDVFDKFTENNEKGEGAPNVILDKNSIANKQARKASYLKMLKEFDLTAINGYENKRSLGNKYFKIINGKFELNFKNELTKHFQDEMAIKIMIQIDLIENLNKIPAQKAVEVQNELWKEHPNQIKELIKDCYDKWSEILEKVSIHQINKP